MRLTEKLGRSGVEVLGGQNFLLMTLQISIQGGFFDTSQFLNFRYSMLPSRIELQRLLELVLVAPGAAALPASSPGSI